MIPHWAVLPGRLRVVAVSLGGYLPASAGGYLFSLLHVSLPWMMGALIVVSVMSFAGRPPLVPRGGRHLGQLVLGVGLGLTFTAGAAEEAMQNIGAMVAAALLTLAAGAALAVPYRRLTHTDIRTALLACIPGGPADMAILAERYGGDPLAVAVAQTFRITVIVTAVPTLGSVIK